MLEGGRERREGDAPVRERARSARSLCTAPPSPRHKVGIPGGDPRQGQLYWFGVGGGRRDTQKHGLQPPGQLEVLRSQRTAVGRLHVLEVLASQEQRELPAPPPAQALAH